MKVDYLIVGQGIAGSVMALTLEQRGKSVAIINDASLSSSSRIAAGVYNPFNFRKSIPVWKAWSATSLAREFYRAAEGFTGQEFHRSKRIVRIFSTEQEKKEWRLYAKRTEREFPMRVLESAPGGQLKSQNGIGILLGGGIVQTEKFVSATRTKFSNRGYYMNELFDHSRLFPNENSVSYDDRVEAGHVIFCEGHLAKTNPFFDSKVTAPTKGELLHVSIPGFNMPAIVNGSVYLAPLENDLYVCGATFNPGKNDEAITASGKEELIAKLKTITDLPFEVIGHYAGVRPAGRDRKPVIGRSRDHRNLSIFNGFGSKAVLMSPFLAQMLADHLETGSEILPEVNVSRFKVY